MTERPEFILFYVQVFFSKCFIIIILNVMSLSESSKINGLLKKVFLFLVLS